MRSCTGTLGAGEQEVDGTEASAASTGAGTATRCRASVLAAEERAARFTQGQGPSLPAMGDAGLLLLQQSKGKSCLFPVVSPAL